MSREHDIKAPDGYLLGGYRRVHKDGAILFQRTYWQAPVEWAGERVHVHADEGSFDGIHAAPPGSQIFHARWKGYAEWCPALDRKGAKPGYRKPLHKKWAEQMRGKA